jgi:hypothetical protein
MGLWWGDFRNPMVEEGKKAAIDPVWKTVLV